MTTYEIPVENLPQLHKKIAQISKRGAKLGTGPVQVHEVRKFTKEDEDTGRKAVFVEFEIKGETPKVDGYEFYATIDHMHSEPLIRLVPGCDIPDHYYTAPAFCDHCNTVRTRKETFVVHNEKTGEWMAVGRNCLRDFFGHDPVKVANYLRYLFKFENWCRNPGNGIRYDSLDLENYLSWVAACIREYGWVSKQKARESEEAYDDNDPKARLLTATSSSAYSETIRKKGDRYWNHLPRIEQDFVDAKAAREWAQKIEANGNEYLRSLQIIAKDGYFHERRELGFAASMMAAYYRETKWKEERAKRENRANEFLGQVGQKLELEVTVKFLKQLPNDYSRYGCTHLHSMETDEGHSVVWFCTGTPLDKDQKCKIRGTVKRHNEYNGRKQTILTRVKEVA